MSRRSVQINIRASAEVADALREEAACRNLSLGATLAALVTLARVAREEGIWLNLPPQIQAALSAVSTARGVEPGDVLGELLVGPLRDELLVIAASLSGGVPPEPAPAQSPELPAEEDDDEEVGLFTVFD